MNYNCQYKKCTEITGSKLVCDVHQRMMSKSQAKRIQIIWHDLIREKGRKDYMIECFHCKKPFDDIYICGDHFPHTKARRPDLKFCVNAGVPSCGPCNDPRSKERLESLRKWKSEQVSL